jgi:hypothetical protein
MKCDYTCLNHNSLMSFKKMYTKGMIIKGVYYIKELSILIIFKFKRNWYFLGKN